MHRDTVRIKLDWEDQAKARAYAHAVVDTVNYSDHNQTRQEKVFYDHFIGKVAEVAVAKAFSNAGNKVKGPDFSVYEGRNKSWEPDLIVAGYELHVKSQTIDNANKYGLSWTFADSSTRRDTVLRQAEAWVCFVVVIDAVGNVECVCYPPIQIKNIQFGDPLMKHLKGKKKVVYAKDNPLITRRQ